ncbi:MAG: ATP-binding protein, partial [Clostridiales Family XIII bacterium]|nr:ATP-binding protein [Clostridiales Family XIII bacterium]
MKFYNREEEIALLQQNAGRAKKQSAFTFVVGRRRVGKTSLLMEAMKDERTLYFFVSRKTEALLCEEFQREAAETLDIEIFGDITHFKDLFTALLRYSEKHPFTLIIDEFQDFERVNRAIFSDIQDVWDRHKSSARMNFIVSGSVYSLMVKQFEDNKEPLFGRADSKLHVRPFSVATTKEILRDHNPKYTPDDLLCLYMVTGCIPKYIALLMDAGATNKKKIFDYLFNEGSPFLTDGKEILVSEFGTDYSTYFSALQLIAQKKNSQREIDSVLGKNTGVYLQNLEGKYNIVSRLRPIFAKPGSRNARWVIEDQYLRFWFGFVYAEQSLIETGRLDILKELTLNKYNTYSGASLEDYFRKKLSEEGRFTQIGRSWDTKGTNEIDIVALNTLDSKALIAEVKRDG